MSKEKKKKIKKIKPGHYTVYWEEQVQYPKNPWFPANIVQNVQGYQFSGTRQDVALHIKYYLARKDNLIKVEVTPFKGKLPEQFDSDSIHGEKYGKEKEKGFSKGKGSGLRSVQERS